MRPWRPWKRARGGRGDDVGTAGAAGARGAHRGRRAARGVWQTDVREKEALREQRGGVQPPHRQEQTLLKRHRKYMPQVIEIQRGRKPSTRTTAKCLTLQAGGRGDVS